MERQNLLDSIINFMWYKQDLITQKLGKEFEHEYFNNNDVDLILEWSDQTLWWVYPHLKQTAEFFAYTDAVDKIGWSIDTDLCPFCILNYNSYNRFGVCKHCKYAKNHGICDSNPKSSSYGKIICKLRAKSYHKTHEVSDLIDPNKILTFFKE